jgi:hypothetical protein
LHLEQLVGGVSRQFGRHDHGGRLRLERAIPQFRRDDPQAVEHAGGDGDLRDDRPRRLRSATIDRHRRVGRKADVVR